MYNGLMSDTQRASIRISPRATPVVGKDSYALACHGGSTTYYYY